MRSRVAVVLASVGILSAFAARPDAPTIAPAETVFSTQAAAPSTVVESQVLNVDINGSWTPPSNSWCTWDAVVTGGTAPYTYRWYVDGNFASPLSSYTGVTGTADFVLRVEVTDAAMNTDYRQVLVDVQSGGSC